VRWLGVRQNCMVSTFGSLFGLATATFILFIHMPVFYAPPLALLPVMLFGNLCVFFFWMFAQALFDDAFRIKAWHFIPAAIILIAAVTCSEPRAESIHSQIIHLTMFGLFAHVFTLAWKDRGSDLVCKRRVFRRAMAIVVPLVGTGIILLDLTASTFPLEGWALYAQTLGVLGLSGLFAFWMSRIDTSILPPMEPATKVHQAKLPAADRLELARLNGAVQDGRLYEPGLTIGMLAESIDVPEHRLRRLINQGLGIATSMPSSTITVWRRRSGGSLTLIWRASRSFSMRLRWDMPRSRRSTGHFGSASAPAPAPFGPMPWTTP